MTSAAEATGARIEVPAVNHVDVVIVGAGFSGLGVAALLDKAGVRSIRILEAADDVGGAWRDNSYPGCGCDIPSPLYSYSFDQKPDWTRLFAGQPEILDYLRGVARRRGLIDRTRFGQRVQRARWVEADGRWEILTSTGDSYRARFLICAVGPLHHPAYPDLPGVETFDGPVFHSATWRHDVDLTGQRVAVIGTGASAIQFVPAIVDQVAALTIFQRTPPWIVPKADRPFDERHRRLARWVPPYRWWVRERLFWIHENRAAGFVTDPAAMEKTAVLARRLIQKQVPDPELREIVTPDYTIGCKRLLISSDWYPALTRPHVAVRRGGVAEVRPRAIVGEDGAETTADVLIYGTGFDSQNTVRIDIVGRDGLTLAEAWSKGNQAYLGTVVAGFPNMFLMVGPNTGLGHNSQVFMIESQARYIVDSLRKLRRRGAECMEVRPEVQDSFNDWLDSRMAGTVWQTGGCRSWYQDPRSGRNTVLWPDTTIAFWRRTRRARMSDYRVRTPRGSRSARRRRSRS
ncbi:NAD(P)/FAD-dependent oxidoreductase [Amycolatopsis dongchuanensis]|uniref:NAD(P)/FAD-dependent oxidoreductase n=1 Tax=Amycolatopsis dongchuanensis TaxID=1070866 RepID=A0ABP8VHK8_9PSEU